MDNAKTTGGTQATDILSNTEDDEARLAERAAGSIAGTGRRRATAARTATSADEYADTHAHEYADTHAHEYPEGRAGAHADAATGLDRRVAHRVQESTVRRGVAAIALMGIALIHLLDLPGKLQETPYLGVGYMGLIGAALLVAEALVRRDGVLVWCATAGIGLATMGGYVVNRTVGMPGAMDDIGNWLEPLGLASLFVEGVVILLAAVGLARRRPNR